MNRNDRLEARCEASGAQSAVYAAAVLDYDAKRLGRCVTDNCHSGCDCVQPLMPAQGHINDRVSSGATGVKPVVEAAVKLDYNQQQYGRCVTDNCHSGCDVVKPMTPVVEAAVKLDYDRQRLPRCDSPSCHSGCDCAEPLKKVA